MFVCDFPQFYSRPRVENAKIQNVKEKPPSPLQRQLERGTLIGRYIAKILKLKASF